MTIELRKRIISFITIKLQDYRENKPENKKEEHKMCHGTRAQKKRKVCAK